MINLKDLPPEELRAFRSANNALYNTSLQYIFWGSQRNDDDEEQCAKLWKTIRDNISMAELKYAPLKDEYIDYIYEKGLGSDLYDKMRQAGYSYKRNEDALLARDREMSDSKARTQDEQKIRQKAQREEAKARTKRVNAKGGGGASSERKPRASKSFDDDYYRDNVAGDTPTRFNTYSESVTQKNTSKTKLYEMVNAIIAGKNEEASVSLSEFFATKTKKILKETFDDDYADSPGWARAERERRDRDRPRTPEELAIIQKNRDERAIIDNANSESTRLRKSIERDLTRLYFHMRRVPDQRGTDAFYELMQGVGVEYEIGFPRPEDEDGRSIPGSVGNLTVMPYAGPKEFPKLRKITDSLLADAGLQSVTTPYNASK